MNEEDSVDLLARWKGGDEQAAALLFDRYTHRLVAMARSQLSERMRRRVEPEDVVQSVFRSFFRKAGDDRYVLNASGDLWKLLAAITISKVRGQVEFHTAKKRGVYSEDSLHAAGSAFGFRPEAITSEPTPEDAAAALEELDAALQTLDPLQQEILNLAFENKEVEEIADIVSRSPRTVRRALQAFRDALQSRLTRSIE